MFCSNCRKQYEGKFCPECGTPAAQSAPSVSNDASAYGADLQAFPEVSGSANAAPVQRGDTKSPKKKKNGCLIAIIVVVVLGIIGSATGGKDSEAPSSSSSDALSISQSSSAISSSVSSTPADSISAASVDNNEDSSIPADTVQIGMDVVMNILRLSLSDSYGTNYTIEGDESGITLSIWQDNIAMGVAAIAQGNTDLRENWDAMSISLQEMCRGVKESVAELGFPDTPVMVNLLNDLDHEKTLLSILDGEVIYDCTK